MLNTQHGVTLKNKEEAVEHKKATQLNLMASKVINMGNASREQLN